MSNPKDKPKERYLLKLGSWYFAPRWKLTLIAVLTLFILVYLGFWQIGRAQQKQNIFKILHERTNAATIDLQQIPEPSLENNRFTPVQVEGLYLNNYTILLDNQMLDHKPGYRVITPMHIPKSMNWLLVDRGWIPLEKDRRQLPKIELIFGMKTIKGIINTIGSGILLEKEPEAALKWPIVLQKLDYDLIAKQLHHPIYPFVLQLNEKQPGSYAQVPIDYGVSYEKHLGYALQWFLFAFILIMYYIIVSTKRRL